MKLRGGGYGIILVLLILFSFAFVSFGDVGTGAVDNPNANAGSDSFGNEVFNTPTNQWTAQDVFKAFSDPNIDRSKLFQNLVQRPDLIKENADALVQFMDDDPGMYIDPNFRQVADTVFQDSTQGTKQLAKRANMAKKAFSQSVKRQTNKNVNVEKTEVQSYDPVKEQVVAANKKVSLTQFKQDDTVEYSEQVVTIKEATGNEISIGGTGEASIDKVETTVEGAPSEYEVHEGKSCADTELSDEERSLGCSQGSMHTFQFEQRVGGIGSGSGDSVDVDLSPGAIKVKGKVRGSTTLADGTDISYNSRSGSVTVESSGDVKADDATIRVVRKEGESERMLHLDGRFETKGNDVLLESYDGKESKVSIVEEGSEKAFSVSSQGGKVAFYDNSLPTDSVFGRKSGGVDSFSDSELTGRVYRQEYAGSTIIATRGIAESHVSHVDSMGIPFGTSLDLPSVTGKGSEFKSDVRVEAGRVEYDISGRGVVEDSSKVIETKQKGVHISQARSSTLDVLKTECSGCGVGDSLLTVSTKTLASETEIGFIPAIGGDRGITAGVVGGSVTVDYVMGSDSKIHPQVDFDDIAQAQENNVITPTIVCYGGDTCGGVIDGQIVYETSQNGVLQAAAVTTNPVQGLGREYLVVEDDTTEKAYTLFEDFIQRGGVLDSPVSDPQVIGLVAKISGIDLNEYQGNENYKLHLQKSISLSSVQVPGLQNSLIDNGIVVDAQGACLSVECSVIVAELDTSSDQYRDLVALRASSARVRLEMIAAEMALREANGKDTSDLKQVYDHEEALTLSDQIESRKLGIERLQQYAYTPEEEIVLSEAEEIGTLQKKAAQDRAIAQAEISDYEARYQKMEKSARLSAELRMGANWAKISEDERKLATLRVLSDDNSWREGVENPEDLRNMIHFAKNRYNHANEQLGKLQIRRDALALQTQDELLKAEMLRISGDAAGATKVYQKLQSDLEADEGLEISLGGVTKLDAVSKQKFAAAMGLSMVEAGYLDQAAQVVEGLDVTIPEVRNLKLKVRDVEIDSDYVTELKLSASRDRMDAVDNANTLEGQIAMGHWKEAEAMANKEGLSVGEIIVREGWAGAQRLSFTLLADWIGENENERAHNGKLANAAQMEGWTSEWEGCRKNIDCNIRETSLYKEYAPYRCKLDKVDCFEGKAQEVAIKSKQQTSFQTADDLKQLSNTLNYGSGVNAKKEDREKALAIYKKTLDEGAGDYIARVGLTGVEVASVALAPMFGEKFIAQGVEEIPFAIKNWVGAGKVGLEDIAATRRLMKAEKAVRETERLIDVAADSSIRARQLENAVNARVELSRAEIAFDQLKEVRRVSERAEVDAAVEHALRSAERVNFCEGGVCRTLKDDIRQKTQGLVKDPAVLRKQATEAETAGRVDLAEGLRRKAEFYEVEKVNARALEAQAKAIAEASKAIRVAQGLSEKPSLRERVVSVFSVPSPDSQVVTVVKQSDEVRSKAQDMLGLATDVESIDSSLATKLREEASQLAIQAVRIEQKAGVTPTDLSRNMDSITAQSTLARSINLNEAAIANLEQFSSDMRTKLQSSGSVKEVTREVSDNLVKQGFNSLGDVDAEVALLRSHSAELGVELERINLNVDKNIEVQSASSLATSDALSSRAVGSFSDCPLRVVSAGVALSGTAISVGMADALPVPCNDPPVSVILRPRNLMSAVAIEGNSAAVLVPRLPEEKFPIVRPRGAERVSGERTNVVAFKQPIDKVDNGITPRVEGLAPEGFDSSVADSLDSRLDNIDGPPIRSSDSFPDEVTGSDFSLVEPITHKEVLAARDRNFRPLQLSAEGGSIEQSTAHFVLRDNQLVPITSEAELAGLKDGQLLFSALLDYDGHVFGYSPAIIRDGTLVRGPEAASAISSGSGVVENKIVLQRFSELNSEVSSPMTDTESVLAGVAPWKDEFAIQPTLGLADLDAARVRVFDPIGAQVDVLGAAGDKAAFANAYTPINTRLRLIDSDIQKTAEEIARLKEGGNVDVARVLALENKVRELKAQKMSDINALYELDFKGMVKQGIIPEGVATELDKLRVTAARDVIDDLLLHDPVVVNKIVNSQKFRELKLLNPKMSDDALLVRFAKDNIEIKKIGSDGLPSDADINLIGPDSVLTDVFPTLRDRFRSIVKTEGPQLELLPLSKNGLDPTKVASNRLDGASLLNPEVMPNAREWLYRLNGQKAEISSEDALSQLLYHMTGFEKTEDLRTKSKYYVRAMSEKFRVNAELDALRNTLTSQAFDRAAKNGVIGVPPEVADYSIDLAVAEVARAKNIIGEDEFTTFKKAHQIYKGDGAAALEGLNKEAFVTQMSSDMNRFIDSPDMLSTWRSLNAPLDTNLESIVSDARRALSDGSDTGSRAFVARYDQHTRDYLISKFEQAGVTPDGARRLADHSFEELLEAESDMDLFLLGNDLGAVDGDRIMAVLADANEDFKALNFRVQKIKYEKASGKSLDELVTAVPTPVRDTVEIPAVKFPVRGVVDGGAVSTAVRNEQIVVDLKARSKDLGIEVSIGSQGEVVVRVAPGSQGIRPEVRSALDELSLNGENVQVSGDVGPVAMRGTPVADLSSGGRVVPVSGVSVTPGVRDVRNLEFSRFGGRNTIDGEKAQEVLNFVHDIPASQQAKLHVSRDKKLLIIEVNNPGTWESKLSVGARQTLREAGVTEIQFKSPGDGVLREMKSATGAKSLDKNVPLQGLFGQFGLSGTEKRSLIDSSLAPGLEAKVNGFDSVAQVSGDGSKARIGVVDPVALRGAPIAESGSPRVLPVVGEKTIVKSVTPQSRVDHNIQSFSADDFWTVHSDTVNSVTGSRYVQVDVDSHGQLLPVGQDGFKVTLRNDLKTGQFVVVSDASSRGLSAEARKVLDDTVVGLTESGVGKVEVPVVVPVAVPPVALRGVPVNSPGRVTQPGIPSTVRNVDALGDSSSQIRTIVLTGTSERNLEDAISTKLYQRQVQSQSNQNFVGSYVKVKVDELGNVVDNGKYSVSLIDDIVPGQFRVAVDDGMPQSVRGRLDESLAMVNRNRVAVSEVDAVVTVKKSPPPLPENAKIHEVTDIDVVSSESLLPAVASPEQLAVTAPPAASYDDLSGVQGFDLPIVSQSEAENIEKYVRFMSSRGITIHVGEVDGVPTIEYWVPNTIASEDGLQSALGVVRKNHDDQFAHKFNAVVLEQKGNGVPEDTQILNGVELVKDGSSAVEALGLKTVSDRAVLESALAQARDGIVTGVKGADAAAEKFAAKLSQLNRYEAYQQKGAFGKWWERRWSGEPVKPSVVAEGELEKILLGDAKVAVASVSEIGVDAGKIDHSVVAGVKGDFSSEGGLVTPEGLIDANTLNIPVSSERHVADVVPGIDPLPSSIVVQAPVAASISPSCSVGFVGNAVGRQCGINMKLPDGLDVESGSLCTFNLVDGTSPTFIYSAVTDEGIIIRDANGKLFPIDSNSILSVDVLDMEKARTPAYGEKVHVVHSDGTVSEGYFLDEDAAGITINIIPPKQGGALSMQRIANKDVSTVRFGNELKTGPHEVGANVGPSESIAGGESISSGTSGQSQVDVTLEPEATANIAVDGSVGGSLHVGGKDFSSTVVMDFSANPDLAPAKVLGGMNKDTPIRFTVDGRVIEGKFGGVSGDKLLYTNERGQAAVARVSRIDAGSVTELSIYESNLGFAKNSPVSVSTPEGVISGRYLSEDDIFVYIKGSDNQLHSVPKVDIASGRYSISGSVEAETVVLDLSLSTNRAKVAGLPSRTVDSAVSSSVIFTMPSGTQGRFPVVFRMEDRDFAVANNLIRENPNLGSLERGASYNYVVLDDGTVVVGKVSDDLEFGVKHLHLANGRPVTVAGELKVGMDGKLTYNLNSNTFMNPLIREGGSTEAGARKAFEAIVKDQIGVIPSFETSTLLPHGPPSTIQLDELCAGHFLNSNVGLCGLLGIGQSKAKKVSSIDDLVTNNRDIFVVQSQGHIQAADMTKGVRLTDGSVQQIVYTLADREFARSRGKLYEKVLPSSLPRGKSYTYVVLEDGTMVFGEVENGLEFGVKHFHLANGRKVKAAGELQIAADGSYEANLLSGTFSKPLVDFYGIPERDLEARVLSVFESDARMGQGTIVKKDLLPSRAPSLEEFKSVCSSSVFELNRGVCGGVMPQTPLITKMEISVPIDGAVQVDLFDSLSIRARAAGNAELADEYLRMKIIAQDKMSEGFFARTKRKLFGGEDVPTTLVIDDPALFKTAQDSVSKRGITWVTNEPPRIMQKKGDIAVGFKDSRGVVEIFVPAHLDWAKVRADINALLKENPTISREEFASKVRAMGCTTPGLPVGGKAYVGKADESCAIIGVTSTDSVTKVVDSANGASEQGIMRIGVDRIGVDRIGINPEVVDLNTKQLIERPPEVGVSSTIKVNGAGLVTPSGTHEVEVVAGADGKIISISSAGSVERNGVNAVTVHLPNSASDSDRILAFTAVAAIVGGGVVLSSDEMVDEIREQVPCVGDISQGCEVLDIDVIEPDTSSSSMLGVNEEIVSIPVKVSTGTPNLRQPVSFSVSGSKVANTLSSITSSVAAKSNFAGKSFVTQLSGNEKRDVEFYVPMGVDFAKPVNIVYLFHGLGDVERTAKVTLPNGISAVESSANTILVYPVSAGKRGTGGGDGEWMSGKGGPNSISALHTDTLNVLREMSPVPFTEGKVNIVCHSAGGQACRNMVSSGGLKSIDSVSGKSTADIPVHYYMADSCYGNWCGATVEGSRSIDTVAVHYNSVGVTGTKNGGDAVSSDGKRVFVEGTNEGHLDFILDTSEVILAQSES